MLAAQLVAQNLYKSDKLTADILLEMMRTNLTQITAENEKIQASIVGEAGGRSHTAVGRRADPRLTIW